MEDSLIGLIDAFAYAIYILAIVEVLKELRSGWPTRKE